jgi:endonuclease/exonuclease/phosphatase family metal-dependent hydrolase/uncharacterized protein (UPF0248 family)
MEPKSKLITSDRAYYNIKWNDSCDVKQCQIVYYDRVKKDYITILFSEWTPIEKGGEIPWHKVYKFLYAGKILWDRESRFYDPTIFTNIPKSNIGLLYYDRLLKKWLPYVDQEEEVDILPETFRVLTWNILFDKHENQLNPKYHFKNRLAHILDEIAELDPDIIALQEVTNTMIQSLLHKKNTMLHSYYVTDLNYEYYGQLIFTKYLPVSQNLISFSKSKSYLHMSFLDSKNNTLELSNIHLTSNYRFGAASKRVLQLRTILSGVSHYKPSIILGDFNTRDKLVPGTEALLDAWIVMNDNNDDGYTFAPNTNPIAKVTSSTNCPGRLDRVLFNGVNLVSLKYVGVEPVDDIWLSDHYGIFVTLTNKEISRQIKQVKKYTFHDHMALGYLLDPESWDINLPQMNKFISLFDRFVNVDTWNQIKPMLNKILEDATSVESVGNKINELLNLPNNTITLSPGIAFNKLTYIMKGFDTYEIIDTLGYTEINKSVIEFIKTIVGFILPEYKIQIVGSRAYGYAGSDYDIVLTCDTVTQDIFHKNCLSLLNDTSYVKYVEYIDSKVKTINIELIDNTEINLIYSQTIHGIIKNELIFSMVNLPEKVKELIANKGTYIDFCKKYTVMRRILSYKKIVGSKYGYLTGVSILLLVLNLYLKIKDNLDQNTKVFAKQFFNMYANYDWKMPINIINVTKLKETYCDRFATIVNILPPYEKVNRNLTATTWNIIKKVFKECNDNFNEEYLRTERVLAGKCIKVMVHSTIKKKAIQLRREIGYQIWKFIKDLDADPDTCWSYEHDNYCYCIGVMNDTDAAIVKDSINALELNGVTIVY